MKNLLLLTLLLIACKEETIETPKLDLFDNPYRLEIKNEAVVQFISKTDTVTMYLENAYALSGETVVFIEK